MAAALTRGVGGAPYAASGLAEVAPHRSVPWRRLLLLLLLLVLLLGLVGLCHRSKSLDTLSQGELVGHRSPVPVHLVLLLDESGSFHDYEQLRRDVLDQVVTWAPRNLRPEDTLTVIGFSGDAATRVATTTVAQLDARAPSYLAAGGADGTKIGPALQLAVDEAAGPAPGPRSLVVLTDTMVEDADRTSADDLVRRLGATTMSVIVPSGVEIEDSWSDAFPYESVFEASVDSQDQTALALGRAVAHATGQRLEAVDG